MLDKFNQIFHFWSSSPEMEGQVGPAQGKAVAGDGFVSFGSQRRGWEVTTALLREQLGSRSLVSHHFSYGCTKEQGRAVAGRDRSCGRRTVSCPHLVAVWAPHEEEAFRICCSFYPKMLQPLAKLHWAVPMKPLPQRHSPHTARNATISSLLDTGGHSCFRTKQCILAVWEGQRG